MTKAVFSFNRPRRIVLNRHGDPVWTNVPNSTVVVTNGQGMIAVTNPGAIPAFYRLSVQMLP
jgi:hypothetical protein